MPPQPAPQLPQPSPSLPGPAMPQGAPPASSQAGAPAVPQEPPHWHDVTIAIKKTTAKACVEGVPPEEFGISRHARSLRDCGYCFHEVIRREEDLIADGYDAAQIKALPTYAMLTNPEELARDTVDEHLSGGGDEGINEVNRQIKITEHYVRMDYEGNNKPALYRVTTGGDQGKVLRLDGEVDVQRVDMIPFAAMTPVIVTHRFFGRSIADLVMDIQRIKTALLRGILDNTYLSVNPRCVVSEANASENTLDDLLVSRPGGVVRVKTDAAAAIQWQTVPAIAGEIFPVLEYADQTREWRTGVSRQSQGLDANALQNQSATAVAQVYSASQARMKLIARIFAETGIRDLFSLLHATIRKNGSQAATVRLRNKWVNVDPRDWKQRNDMTINVGLGSGGKSERLAHVMAVINLQKDAVAAGMTNLVTAKNLYASAGEVCKLVDLKNPDEFFTDPSTQPAPQAPPDPKMMQIQGQLELQQAKQQTDAAHQNAKAQSDMVIQQQKSELAMREMLFKAHTEMQSHAQEMHQNNQKHAMTMAQMAAKIQQSQTPSAAVEVKHNSKDIAGPIADVVGQLGAHLAAHSTAQTNAIIGALQHLSAPKRIVRGADGKVSHVEPMGS